MTVATPDPSGSAVPYDEDWGDVGLEDIEATDVVIPRLTIDHGNASFKNNLTGETFTEIRAVLLGLVKQRIFWSDAEYEENDKPLCKSTDATLGFPQMREDLPADKVFPWSDSNFNKDDYPPRDDYNGLIALPCAQCKFADWGKDPRTNKNTPPPCTEQFTYPLLYLDGQGELVPALFTVQKTGIKPAKQYNSYFASSRTPFFTVFTTLTLSPESKGMVRWAVPRFSRGDQTDRSFWPGWGDQARTIREFIRQPPRNNDADTTSGNVAVPGDNVNRGPEEAAPAAAPAPAPEASTPPAAAPAPAPATPAPAAPPAAATPPPAAATPPPAASPAAPAPAPAPTTPPPAAPAPASAPDAESPAPAQTPPASDNAADDDDIPF